MASNVTLRVAMGRYFKSERYCSLTESVQRRHYSHLHHLRSKLSTPIDEIGSDDLVKASKKARGPCGQRSVLLSLRTFFRWAEDENLVQRNPLRRAPKPVSKRRLPFTAREIETLWENAHLEPSFLLPAMEIGLRTGQRIGDIAYLKMDAFDGEYITISQRKTGADVRFRPDPWLKDYLLAREGQVYVLDLPVASTWRDVYIQRHLRCYLARCGIVGKSFHSFRKTAAVWLAEKGGSDAQIMSLLGHKTVKMAALYRAEASRSAMATTAAGVIAERIGNELKWKNASPASDGSASSILTEARKTE